MSMLNRSLFRRFYYLTLVILPWIASCKKDNASANQQTTGNQLTDTTLLNLSYGSNTQQVYDLFLPAGRSLSTPVILLIHGGAWKAGQKEDMTIYMNLNYRLASNSANIHHNEMMADIGALVQHLAQQKNTYQISDKLGLIGASAGGQLAMIYAYKYNPNIKCVANIFGPSIINDWSWYNSTNLWLGGYTGNILAEYVGQPWDSLAYKEVSPYWAAKNTSPPTILFHGNLDPIVPVYQSQWMHGKLGGIGLTHQYHEYIAFHGFDDAQNDDVIKKTITFFNPYLK
jgi:acetyl esterase/lipase